MSRWCYWAADGESLDQRAQKRSAVAWSLSHLWPANVGCSFVCYPKQAGAKWLKVCLLWLVLKHWRHKILTLAPMGFWAYNPSQLWEVNNIGPIESGTSSFHLFIKYMGIMMQESPYLHPTFLILEYETSGWGSLAWGFFLCKNVYFQSLEMRAYVNLVQLRQIDD